MPSHPAGDAVPAPEPLTSSAKRLRVSLTPPQAALHTSAVLWTPEGWVAEADPDRPALVLATGAGTDLTHPVLRTIARGLSRRGLPTVTFNFAYTEAGRKRPDPPARLQAAFRDVLAAVPDELGGGRPLFIGGRSLGGRMASHLAAEGVPVSGLVLLGYPLHPAGKPERLRTDHWPQVSVPSLFVQGERDALSNLGLLERERADKLRAPSTLHVVRGADHGFAVRVRDGRDQSEVLEEVVDVVARWVDAVARRSAGGLAR